MKKVLLYLALSLVVVLVVVYVTLQFFLGSIVKTSVNQMGPRLTQSKVELAGASVSPLSGAGTLTGFTVDNPAGWSSAHAVSVGEVHFDVAPLSLMREPVVINDLTLEKPEFVYETKLVSSNIGDLLNNIKAAVGDSNAPQKQDEKARKFIVKHFRMHDAKVTIGVGPAAVPLNVPTVELTDLGVKEGGLTSAQLSVAVMKEVLPQIVSATTSAAGTIGGTLGSAASEAVKKAGEGLQKLFGSGKK